MIQIFKPLKIKCVAPEDKMPKKINGKDWYPVIGVKELQYRDKDNRIQSSTKFIVINDEMEYQEIVSYNCKVIVDEKKKDTES